MSSEFPFTGTTAEITSTIELPLFKEMAWDFDNVCFLYDSAGNHIVLEGAEAMKIWVYKALKTERYQYLAYSWQYGIEVKPFIGKVMDVQERLSELKRVVVECLMVNPYIKSIDDVSFEQTTADKITCTVSLTTTYGEVNVNV